MPKKIKLGIIVGTDVSYAETKFVKKNMKWLKHLPKEWDNWDGYSFDLAVLCSAIKHGKEKGIEVVAIDGGKMTLADLDACNYVFPLYEIGYAFWYGGTKGVKRYESLMRKTKASLVPSLSFQQFIVHKLDYMAVVKKAGIDIIPTIGLSMKVYEKNKTKFIKDLLTKQNPKKWGKCIMKPELAGFKSGFKLWNNWNRATPAQLRKHFDSMVKKGYPNVLFQPHVGEFGKFYEVSTYWLNGEYLYAYGTKFKSTASLDFVQHHPQKDGGQMSDKLVDMVKVKAEKVISILKKEFTNIPVQLRIDFGCCVENDNYIRDFFLNEIEFVPTINETETIQPNYYLLGKAVVDRVVNRPRDVAERRRNLRKTQKKKGKKGKKFKSAIKILSPGITMAGGRCRRSRRVGGRSKSSGDKYKKYKKQTYRCERSKRKTNKCIKKFYRCLESSDDKSRDY
jgi:hypothetical protein